MQKINRTYVMSAVFILFAIFIIVQTGKIPERLVSNEPGPKLFPYISAFGIILMAILSAIFDGKKEKTSNAKPYLDKNGWKRMAIIMLECVLFVVGMNVIGFWFTAIIGMFVFVWTLKSDKKINIIFAIVLCVALSTLCYFGFTKGFNIPLPKGVLWDIIGIQMP